MALVDIHVVRITTSHKIYGAGDVIGLKPAEYAAYQADPKFAKLVQLVHIDHPNGERTVVDEDGKPTAKLSPEDVKRISTVRSKVHDMVREERLTAEDERRFIDKAMQDPAAFLADPAGYLQGRAPSQNRAGAGPQKTR